MDVERFEVHVPDAVLADLRERIGRTRWPDSLDADDWTPGAAPGWMRRFADHWVHRFDWRAEEARLNAFPQVRVTIDGLRVHALHVRGRGPRPMPLVMTHGWPGSVFEMLKIIPLLTDPGAHGADPADAFDLVVPSMVGFGFSDPATARGISTETMAGMWVELMARLGYDRFGTQGGDFGAGISTWLGRRHASRLIGLHLNYIPGSYRPGIASDAALAPDEQQFLVDLGRWIQDEGAYGHVHSTRPQTLAHALNDSPVGLAAWILEKIRGWSDCGGDLTSRFSMDELCAAVTVYWVTQTIHSSMRLYRERAPLALAPGERIAVPCGVARFPLEAPSPPRAWVERGYDVVRWTEMPRGGHFAAWEEPELLADDVRALFRPLRAG